MTVHPSHPAGTALRQRMIEDMSVRGFTEKTQHDYIRCVKTFAAFLGRSPDRATADDLRRFQLHQTQVGLRPGISSSSAIRRASATVAPLPPSWHPCAGKNWFVYAKPPFAGPEAVLAYLSRYTHRVAISNSRLISLDDR